MTVTDIPGKTFATGDGATVLFSFNFKVYTTSDVKVYDAESLVDPADYTIALNTTTIGGTITFDTAPALNNQLLFERELDYTQPERIPNVSKLPVDSINRGLDRIALLVQQVKEIADRALVQSPFTESVSTIVFPTAEALKVIRWNAGGTALENVAEDSSSAAAAAASAAAALVSETNAAASAAAAAASAVEAANVVDPTSNWILSDDFTAGISGDTYTSGFVGDTNWKPDVSGTGALLSVGSGLGNAVGNLNCEVGTTTSGRAGFRREGINVDNFTSLSMKIRAYHQALSIVSEEFISILGFGNIMSAEPGFGAYFYYDRLTDGDFWVCKTANSSRTKTVTAVAPSTSAYQNLEILFTGTGSLWTDVKFYIDGVLVATHTTNIPTSLLDPLINMIKSAGTSNRILRTDFIYINGVYDRS